MALLSTSAMPRRGVLTLVALLLVALNLRPALTSVSPVLGNIGEALALSPSWQGILTTLPVLFLGLAAPLAPRLVRRIGPERSVFAALVVLAVALLVRPYIGTMGLFLGTAVAGGCIGIIGVLLPGIVKRDFPRRVSIMTGLYTVALNLGASTAAGTTEPLRQLLDDVAQGASLSAWQGALAFWLLPAVIAALLWLPQLRGTKPTRVPARRGARLRHDSLAWQVSLFMGLQSSLAYIVFGWLPTILQDRGLTAVTAGLALSVSILLQVSTAILAPWIGSRMRDQRTVLAVVMTLTLIGLLGCLYAPIGSVWLWIVVLGLGQGGTFSMALTLLALRAPDATTAASLSAMAQGIGYTLAAAGPLLVGVLHDWSGGWNVVGVLVSAIALGALVMALGAGRNRQVASTQGVD
ncbi:CynX/NimT family MFS transporter [Chromohalobacter israelensis]|uniref:Major facilitator superfamily MFS_1 n=1 Tax=Chromohalobacter israelensis (strain ATCC BAA-138 / DSM 3043 / CIP 106854 / NCIMB 13768 / 1H11) TaxID=290398 RepID=Q1QSJ6_CHRI1|nr:major facilitator superfamily MFS_1 [Chromohalobacter salexigens DSM 3043]NWO55223.1 MFS transporter [Chromohalobacter salexigens]RXE46476.1 MFS transporter [Chromohalobacter salexigens]